MNLRLDCCEPARRLIRYHRASNCDGPEVGGFAINVSGGGDAAWERIAFCPFCGTRVEHPA